MTEEAVAPLDAYVTAKPGEPTWTVQGGDPLGAPLLRVWAAFARLMAGVISPGVLDGIFAELREAANKNPPDGERGRDELLVRATQTEEVSWAMDEYRRSGYSEQPAEDTGTHLTELQRIDLHDLRVRCAQKLSNFRCEIEDMREALQRAGFTDLEPLSDLKTAAYNLDLLNRMIEPRRIFKKD